MEQPNTSEFKPPYLSFQTFWAFIQELASKPLPPQIDRSMMDTKSGTDQSNILSTMRAFGLIDESQAVMPFLQQLVRTDENPTETGYRRGRQASVPSPAGTLS